MSGGCMPGHCKVYSVWSQVALETILFYILHINKIYLKHTT